MQGGGSSGDGKRVLRPGDMITTRQAFRGVGGQVTSTVTKVYPVGLSRVHGELCSCEAPGSLPLLLSRPFMQKLGTIIDVLFREDRCSRLALAQDLARPPRGEPAGVRQGQPWRL